MHTLIEANRHFSVEGFYTAFRLERDGSFVFTGESHDFWEIVFITTGAAEITEDENVYLLGENQIILHAPMEFHRIKSADRQPFGGYILSFQSSGSMPERLRDGVFLLNSEERERYTKLCSAAMAIVENRTDHAYSAQAAAAQLEIFLIELAESTAERRTSASAGASSYRSLVSQMSERVCDNLTLEELAQLSGLSISYIQQLFGKYAGVSPKRYYTHLRLRQAMQLLESGCTATEVADRMNFSSPAYFTEFFRKHTGTTPGAFRRRMDAVP